jgi:hypothetical protein
MRPQSARSCILAAGYESRGMQIRLPCSTIMRAWRQKAMANCAESAHHGSMSEHRNAPSRKIAEINPQASKKE